MRKMELIQLSIRQAKKNRYSPFIAILTTYAVFISFSNIDNCFFWDDFHLIRSFSGEELKICLVWQLGSRST